MIRIAALYEEIEDLETSRGYYKIILSEYPNNTTALFKLGKIYFMKNELIKAKTYLEKYITLKHDNAETFLLLSKTYYKLENYMKAFDYISLWFEKKDEFNISDKTYNENIIYLSDIYVNIKKYNEALNVLRPLLENEEFIKEALLRITKIYILLKEFEKATSIVSDYIIKVPQDEKIPVLYELANAYFGEGELYKAITIWTEITSFNPKYKDVNEILEKYKILDENKFLENYFTNNEEIFSSFIMKSFGIKEYQINYRNKTFWIIKEENLCHVLYKEPNPIIPLILNSIENYIIDEGMSTYSVTLFSLFGADKSCYSINFFKKINLVSGEQFILFFNKN